MPAMPQQSVGGYIKEYWLFWLILGVGAFIIFSKK